MKIKTIKNGVAVDKNGKKIKLNLLDGCKVGEYVLTQADMAIEKISKRRAQEISRRLSLLATE